MTRIREEEEELTIKDCLTFCNILKLISRDVASSREQSYLFTVNVLLTLFYRGSINSRMGAFPDIFSMTNGRFKHAE